MPLENVPDMSGRKRIRMTVNSAFQMTSNADINKLFSQNSHFSFQIGECAINEILYTKGHESDSANGSWAIINENKYLKIVLHETNAVNSLVYVSNNQILNSYFRNLISINWNNTTKVPTLYVNGIEEPMTINTSQPHYRTTAGAFTGLRTTPDLVKIGRGVVLPYGTFSIYYDLCDQKMLTQPEIADYWNTIKDERIAPTLGDIVFLTDRDSFINAYEMLENGTNVTLKHSLGANATSMQYVSDGDGITITKFDTVYYKDELGVIKTSAGLIDSSWSTLSLNKQFLTYIHNGNINSKDIIANGIQFIEPFLNTGGFYNTPFQYHPTNANLILCCRFFNNQPHILSIKNKTNGAETILYTTPFSPTDAGLRVTNAKFSKDGTKVCFNIYMNSSGTIFRAYIINSDGTGLTQLAETNYTTTPTEVWCFSPDGTKVILSKTVTDIGYTNKKQLFIRDLNTNVETQITFHNSNNYMADWKA